MDRGVEAGARMRVYIAGPIAGMPNGNEQAFNLRAGELLNAGHEPVNPWDIEPDHTGPCLGEPVPYSSIHGYGCFLRADIEVLMYCDAITLLPGWQDSRGASTEERVARALSLRYIP